MVICMSGLMAWALLGATVLGGLLSTSGFAEDAITDSPFVGLSACPRTPRWLVRVSQTKLPTVTTPQLISHCVVTQTMLVLTGLRSCRYQLDAVGR